MKQEELLAAIDKIYLDGFDGALIDALRAVIKLHTPKEFEFNDQPVLVCGHCQLGIVGDEYPCETIHTIERVLTLG